MSKLRAIWSLIWCKKFYLYFDGKRMQNNCRVNDMGLIKIDCTQLVDQTFTDAQQDANIETVNKILQS